MWIGFLFGAKITQAHRKRSRAPRFPAFISSLNWSDHYSRPTTIAVRPGRARESWGEPFGEEVGGEEECEDEGNAAGKISEFGVESLVGKEGDRAADGGGVAVGGWGGD